MGSPKRRHSCPDAALCVLALRVLPFAVPGRHDWLPVCAGIRFTPKLVLRAACTAFPPRPNCWPGRAPLAVKAVWPVGMRPYVRCCATRSTFRCCCANGTRCCVCDGTRLCVKKFVLRVCGNRDAFTVRLLIRKLSRPGASGTPPLTRFARLNWLRSKWTRLALVIACRPNELELTAMIPLRAEAFL